MIAVEFATIAAANTTGASGHPFVKTRLSEIGARRQSAVNRVRDGRPSRSVAAERQQRLGRRRGDSSETAGAQRLGQLLQPAGCAAAR